MIGYQLSPQKKIPLKKKLLLSWTNDARINHDVGIGCRGIAWPYVWTLINIDGGRRSCVGNQCVPIQIDTILSGNSTVFRDKANV